MVSVDYRLGPEEPYPAAVEDAVEALHWVHEKGKSELNVNVNKFAVGGSSRYGLKRFLVSKHLLSQLTAGLILQRS